MEVPKLTFVFTFFSLFDAFVILDFPVGPGGFVSVSSSLLKSSLNVIMLLFFCSFLQFSHSLLLPIGPIVLGIFVFRRATYPLVPPNSNDDVVSWQNYLNNMPQVSYDLGRSEKRTNPFHSLHYLFSTFFTYPFYIMLYLRHSFKKVSQLSKLIRVQRI